MSANWYADHGNLAALARFMVEEGATVDEVVYMLEKPWKFSAEWDSSLVIDEAARIVEAVDASGVDE